MALNEQQELAVKTLDGPVLVVAAPGSGKTRVIMHRIEALLDSGVDPREILAVTFTRAAAMEMKRRLINKKGEEQAKRVTISTFHGLAIRIIRSHGYLTGYRPNFSIYDTKDQLDILSSVLKDLNIKRPTADTILEDIDLPKYAHAKAEYRDRIRGNNAMDYDMLIETALDLLHKPECLQAYASRYRYISVDEFQDLNGRQYEMATLLASQHRNICAVGDPDQAIFAFQGANIRYILDFQKDFPDTKVINLNICYRCPIKVLECANSLIKNNRQRLEKESEAFELYQGVVKTFVFDNDTEEVDWIVSKCKEIREKTGSLARIAILARTHRLKNTIALAFKDIPINICGRTEEFYRSPVIVLLLDYLRLIQNPYDDFCMKKIINIPDREISNLDMLKCMSFVRAMNVDCLAGARLYFSDPKHSSPNAVSFCDQMLSWRKEMLDGNSSLVIHSVARMLMDHFNKVGLNGRVSDLKTFLTKYANIDITGFLSIEELLAYITELDSQDDVEGQLPAINGPEQDAVQLMTVHTAKGLEFDTVFIPGMEMGIFPISAANKNLDEMEQERRLLYVGITRAESDLYLTRSRERMVAWGAEANLTEPSTFLEELSLG